jgi:transposase
MVAEKLSMKKVREVLRLHHEGMSYRAISQSTHIGLGSVSHYIQRAKNAGLSWPLPKSLNDEGLRRLLFPKEIGSNELEGNESLNFKKIHEELKRKGVTLLLLWYEYKVVYPQGYSYSRYCHLYQQYANRLKPSMRITHYAGEKMFVDYSGLTMPWIDKETGIIYYSEIFVAVLGASNYTYVEACASQNIVEWIKAHCHALEFFKGVPRCIVPDNLKAGVSKAHRYDPDIHSTYQELANHYGCAITPARAYHPKDKPKVEVGVQGIQRWILAPLRDVTFFSIAEINQALEPLLKAYNERPFQELEGSRRSQYETLDKPALNPLPATRYSFAQWKTVRAGIDYHVTFEKHHYSIPHQYLKRTIELRVTHRTIECFYEGQRIAVHHRAYKPGHTTIYEHMPTAHQSYAEWTPERLKKWASHTGPYTQALIEELMGLHKIPEQSFRSCLGILRLGERYGASRLELAAQRGLRLGAIRYKNIESILRNNLDKQPLPSSDHEAKAAPRPHHGNIRGSAYYH